MPCVHKLIDFRHRNLLFLANSLNRSQTARHSDCTLQLPPCRRTPPTEQTARRAENEREFLQNLRYSFENDWSPVFHPWCVQSETTYRISAQFSSVLYDPIYQPSILWNNGPRKIRFWYACLVNEFFGESVSDVGSSFRVRNTLTGSWSGPSLVQAASSPCIYTLHGSGEKLIKLSDGKSASHFGSISYDSLWSGVTMGDWFQGDTVAGLFILCRSNKLIIRRTLINDTDFSLRNWIVNGFFTVCLMSVYL